MSHHEGSPGIDRPAGRSSRSGDFIEPPADARNLGQRVSQESLAMLSVTSRARRGTASRWCTVRVRSHTAIFAECLALPWVLPRDRRPQKPLKSTHHAGTGDGMRQFHRQMATKKNNSPCRPADPRKRHLTDCSAARRCCRDFSEASWEQSEGDREGARTARIAAHFREKQCQTSNFQMV